jgi:putative tryptophan/tyrosine transport system substrate-binding protein
MRRREFITLVGGAAIMWPLVANAKRSQGTLPLVGAIWPGNASAPISLRIREAFQQGLREDGYVEGKNFAIEHRYGEGLDEFREAADELVHLDVDVIMAMGTPAILAAKRATSAIPIVGGGMADPVADGLVASLARPGGNITGNTFIGPELGPKRLQLLRVVVPAATRIAALQHPGVYSELTMQNMLTEMEEKAQESGVELQVFSASGPGDFDAAFEAMVKGRAEALEIFPSPMFYVSYRSLVDLAARHQLPTMYAFREAVEAGGLMSYGADLPDLSRQAAKYVAKVLKGAKSADLPVLQPTKFDLVINLSTAKALGLTVPASLIASADELIE